MLATEMFSGKPDAGNPPVRFEEGEDGQHPLTSSLLDFILLLVAA